MGKIFVTLVNVDLMAKFFPWSFIFLSEHTLKLSIYSGLAYFLLKNIVEFDNVVEFNNTGCQIPQRCRILYREIFKYALVYLETFGLTTIVYKYVNFVLKSEPFSTCIFLISTENNIEPRVSRWRKVYTKGFFKAHQKLILPKATGNFGCIKHFSNFEGMGCKEG